MVAVGEDLVGEDLGGIRAGGAGCCGVHRSRRCDRTCPSAPRCARRHPDHKIITTAILPAPALRLRTAGSSSTPHPVLLAARLFPYGIGSKLTPPIRSIFPMHTRVWFCFLPTILTHSHGQNQHRPQPVCVSVQTATRAAGWLPKRSAAWVARARWCPSPPATRHVCGRCRRCCPAPREWLAGRVCVGGWGGGICPSPICPNSQGGLLIPAQTELNRTDCKRARRRAYATL